MQAVSMQKRHARQTIFIILNFLFITPSQYFKYFSGIRVGLYLRHDLFDNAVFVNYKGCAHNSEAYLSVKLLFLPYAVRLDRFKLGIGKQNEG